MTKLRMGSANPITAERFHTIKAAIAEKMSDGSIKEKYSIKDTTLRYIKMSNTYYEYKLRTEGTPPARKMPTVIEPNSGVAYEDFSYKKRAKPKKSPPDQSNWQDELYNRRILATTSIVMITIISLVALFVIACSK